MPEHTTPSEQRLLTLSRYIRALEQGEIETLSEVLREAERDPVLAHLLQEVDALYQEIDHTAVSELEARRAIQTVLTSLQVSTISQNSHGTHEQPALLRKIRIQHGNKEILMEEEIVSPMPLEKNEPPHLQRRPHKRWLQVLAAILVVGVLIAATPILLSKRPQTGVSAHLSPTPTAVPLTGHAKYKALASQYVSHMSLDEEIGQLIMLQYDEPSYSDNLDYAIYTLHVGGVIMYEYQLNSFNQAKGDIAHMQQRANIPLLISTDEEGGPYVHRLKNIYGQRMSATQIGQSGDINVATREGLKVSQQLAALGINVNLAPDVDVNLINGYDMLTRTFGKTPTQVITFAGAYMKAMQGNGTIACIKHFPGLGGAVPDAHTILPVVNSTRQQIYDLDLAPFKAFIQSSDAQLNPGMIMSVGMLMPAIDPKYPAELSHTFITDILRNEFHYDGVVITDALYMRGISSTWDLNTAAVMALQAGNDMLLGANDSQQASSMIDAIKQALQDGRLTKTRIDEAVTRIIALKMQYHLMPTNAPGA